MLITQEIFGIKIDREISSQVKFKLTSVYLFAYPSALGGNEYTGDDY